MCLCFDSSFSRSSHCHYYVFISICADCCDIGDGKIGKGSKWKGPGIGVKCICLEVCTMRISACITFCNYSMNVANSLLVAEIGTVSAVFKIIKGLQEISFCLMRSVLYSDLTVAADPCS